MRSLYIGSCYAELCDTNRMKGAPLDPTDTGIALGFRLVTDEWTQPLQRTRGGGWKTAASSARVTYRPTNAPACAGSFIGFRLCVDWGK
jgi:formylglycine-generating enzyme required for sulfatase activity